MRGRQKTNIDQADNKKNDVIRDYESKLEELRKNYEDQRNKYNAIINPLNSERLTLRKEIDKLYTFLTQLGEAGEKISVFQYEDEDLAPILSGKVWENLQQPDFKDKMFNHNKNNKKLIDYHVAIGKLDIEYQVDIDKKQLELKHLELACEIARIYRNTVVIVKDFIDDEIIPELSFIQAFLIADSVNEEVLTGGDIVDTVVAGISEYKGTNKEKHYRFVQNVHDFYLVITSFFEKKILTNLLEDREITAEEQADFKASIEAIYEKAELVQREKVL